MPSKHSWAKRRPKRKILRRPSRCEFPAEKSDNLNPKFALLSFSRQSSNVLLAPAYKLQRPSNFLLNELVQIIRKKISRKSDFIFKLANDDLEIMWKSRRRRGRGRQLRRHWNFSASSSRKDNWQNNFDASPKIRSAKPAYILSFLKLTSFSRQSNHFLSKQHHSG